MSSHLRLAPRFGPLLAFLCVAVLACRTPPTGGERPAAATAPDNTVVLDRDWRIRSSDGLAAGGAEVSRRGFALAGWVATRVPSTVLAALVRAGEYKDPYFGDNLDKIPKERFGVPWWYRTEFTLADPPPASVRLRFEGINYRADVWLNGVKLSGRDEIAGAFRVFDLDVTSRVVPGANVLAVEVFPPQPGEPSIGFVDWNPAPPDRNLGLWREVKLRTTGEVSLDDVFVRSELDPATLAEAGLTVGARVMNRSARAVTAKLSGRIGEIELALDLALAPGEERALTLTPAEFPQLTVRSPQLWWPNNLGEPHLYRLALAATVDGALSDRQDVDFGIRHVADHVDAEGHRGYSINGREILIRGGGWVDDLLLDDDNRRLEDQMRYVKHLNLNTIRLEGFWGSTQKLYELADRYGILVWVGWSCQWEWDNYLGQPVDPEFGGIDTPAEMDLITQSLADQVIRLRNHPSVMVWNLGSDMLPRPELERRYRELLATIDPTRPPLAACSVRDSKVSGPTGVKMNGPYEWEPPDYWYLDSEHGGAFGFNTETGPGAQPPPAASLRRMLPPEHWWPIDAMWSYHCGRNEFANLDRYVRALDARYGKSAGLDEFARKAQVANYEAMRPMFEAFSLRRPRAKGVVQWMLNSSWPDLFWQLYDWYLVSNGAFYATRNANRTIHVAWDYGERKVVAVNDTGAALSGVVARVRVLDAESRILFDDARTLDLAPGSRTEVLALPELANLSRTSPVFFLDLRLADAGQSGDQRAPLATNFYWLPAAADELDWGKSEWFMTPVRRFADLSALSRLPAAQLEVTHSFSTIPDGQAIAVQLVNSGPTLSFFVELEVTGSASGQPAAPIYWEDNAVSLLPGERREIHGWFPAHALSAQPGERPVFDFHAMNVPREGSR